MATLSDYTDGTITVTNGSVDFTGTNTLWRGAAFREGDTVLLQGFTGVIAGTSENDPLILSNTTGQFTEPWPGASGTFAYRMRYQPDNARFSAKSTALINLLANGILRGIADIGVEEGKLLIGGVAGLYDLIDKSELGLQDPNGSLVQIAELPDIGSLGLILLGLSTGTSAQIIQANGAIINKSDLPVSNPTQTALNGKASLSGANFTGAVVGSSVGFNATAARSTTTPGQTNTGGAVRSSITGTNMFSNLVIQELVGSYVNATLHVSLDSGNQAFFTFRHNGAMNVPGALSKGSGTFLIDHPLDPLNKNLRHGFVEAPRYDLIYRGTVHLVDGRATVDIDAASNMTSGIFSALTTNAVVTCLQNQDGFARMKPGPINGGLFEIICEDETCTDLVSWVVIAERNDPFVKSDLDQNTDSDGRFVPEFEKEDA
nr:hypothetical protein [Brucella anthropi]